MIENFFKRGSIIIDVDGSPAAEVKLKKDVILIEVKNPILLMSLGLDLDMIHMSFGKDKGKSVIRKVIKDMGYKIKLRYKLFELDL
jgi:hypothetical protein